MVTQVRARPSKEAKREVTILASAPAATTQTAQAILRFAAVNG
jgi:hypothetical protein